MKKKDIIEELGSNQINEMMHIDQYWSLIGKSCKNSRDQDEQEKFLIRELSELPLKDLIGFELRTSYLMNELYTSDLWCAATIINDTGSDDLFEYFRSWILSMGKQVYKIAKGRPDNLLLVVDPNNSWYEFEAFRYIPWTVFRRKTKHEIWDFIGDIEEDDGNCMDIEFNWDMDDPLTMYRICPKLFSTYFFKKFVNPDMINDSYIMNNVDKINNETAMDKNHNL